MADTAAAEYERLKTLRSLALEAAERAAALTLVTHVPSFQDDDNEGTRERLQAPYQMIGAAGVNNLSSKIALAWLPPSQTFARLKVSDAFLEDQGVEERTEIEEDLVKIERLIMDEVEVRRVRPAFHEAVKHLIMAGNVCLRMVPGKNMRVFPMSCYVTQWDDEQNLLTLIIEEKLAWASLPMDLQEIMMEMEPGDRKPTDQIKVYTCVKREGKKFKVHQEVGSKGAKVPGSETTYKLDELPYNPLRWSIDSEQPYGYGLIEEYQGALESLEGFTQAISEGVGASVKVVFLVNPNGMTRVDDLARTPNGGFVAGREEDISVLQVNKQADLSVAAAAAEEIKRELARVFLLNAAVTRNAERVTAEEIRLLQLELDTALGGVFASLGQSFSLWLVRLIMRDLAKRKEIPKLDKAVKPTIITGIEALGRGAEVNQLHQGLSILQQMGIPLDQAGVKPPGIAKRVFVGLGIETEEILQTAEERQAQVEQQNTQQLVDSIGSDVIRAQAGQEQQAPPQ